MGVAGQAYLLPIDRPETPAPRTPLRFAPGAGGAGSGPSTRLEATNEKGDPGPIPLPLPGGGPFAPDGLTGVGWGSGVSPREKA